MGTNYYIGRRNGYHIGKSSAGWCFSLHVDEERGINSLSDLKRKWKSRTIVNEYGEKISKKKMLSIITERSWKRASFKPDGFYKPWAEFHKKNYSEDGPNGLIRHKIDDIRCIDHGEGTYDYIQGVFS